MGTDPGPAPAEDDPVTLLRDGISSSFVRRVITIRPGDEHPCRPAEFDDELVVVERGEIQVVCWSGKSRDFGHGAVLVLAGVAVRFLRNPGLELAVVTAASRRREAGEIS